MLTMIANHLWQSTLFAAAVALATLAFRRDGAHVRYWLWWAASIKFLVPFSLLTLLGRRIAPDASLLALPETWSAAAQRVAEPVATAGSPALVTLTLLAVWLAGCLAVLGRWLTEARRVRALRRAAEPGPVLFDGRRRVAVYHSDALLEPSMVGLFTPALVLPRGIGARLTTAQLDAVIAHELVHARRRDNLSAAAHMLVEAVFWFHPLVWWLGARLVDERERACDEAVVRDGHDRATYAEGILNVCELYTAAPLACAAGVGGADLKQRVTQIMRGDIMSKLRFSKKALLGAAAVAVLGTPVLAGLLSQNVVLAQQRDVPALIVRVAPVYPPRALERGLEGYVIVEYTIAENGSPTDLFVVESTAGLFEDAALEAVSKYKHDPRQMTAPVPGVQAKITFEVEQDI